jgi:hypothetical protein
MCCVSVGLLQELSSQFKSPARLHAQALQVQGAGMPYLAQMTITSLRNLKALRVGEEPRV